MSITSFSFIIFAFSTLLIYYIVPKKMQWWILLASSIVFYLLCSAKGIIFVILTSLTVYMSTNALQQLSDKQKKYFRENKETLSKNQKDELKAKNKKTSKWILVITLVANFGILCVVKYSHFAVGTINNLLSLLGIETINNSFSIIVPLGLSFYTFQSMGYLINVYWKNTPAEKNYFRVLLFTSFFPQITQGPISEYDSLSAELFKEHTFSYKNYAWGFQRMLWGFMKKMVIANNLAPWVSDVFANYNEYSGITCLIGAFLYSIQIYADFSGYMDIMCGFCEMLGITLTENFERPYFSKSIAEYWRRWHISLGAWFKQYIYYPIGVSKWNRRLGKQLTDKFGAAVGKNFPATIALVAVWLTTGLWHGASWAYVAWGGVNGLIIIFSMWMEPIYDKAKSALHIKEHNYIWRSFQVIRTFILVTFIKVLPEVGTLSDGFGLWKRILTEHSIPTSISELLPFCSDLIWWQGYMLVALLALWAASSFIQRKKPIREYFNEFPTVVRIAVLVIIFFAIATMGIIASMEGGFMYEGF